MKVESCKGAPNFELNSEHNRTISYNIEIPKNKAKGLVFFVSCFGLDDPYINNWLLKVANEFNLLAVCVKYHCWKSRPETGAQINITQDLDLKIKGLCYQLNIEKTNDIQQTLSTISTALNYQLYLEGFLLCSEEKQNFGLMQALDHLYVLDDIIKKNYKFYFNNIICFGSSHGGYISHLIAKLAPNTIRLIIDNSSYISPPHNYMGLGSEYSINMGNIILGCSTDNQWQHTNPNLDNYYNIHNHLIRDVANTSHLSYCKMDLKRRVQVIAYNYKGQDYISPPTDKQCQQKIYTKNGFKYQLNLIDKIDDVFKSKGHGMDASLWGLFQLAIKNNLEIQETELDILSETEIIFDCLTADYIINYNKSVPIINIKKHRIH